MGADIVMIKHVNLLSTTALTENHFDLKLERGLLMTSLWH